MAIASSSINISDSAGESKPLQTFIFSAPSGDITVAENHIQAVAMVGADGSIGSGGGTTSDLTTAKLFSGDLWTVSSNAGLDPDEYLDIIIDPSACAAQAHLYWQIKGQSDITVDLYEDATPGTGTNTTITPVNKNRKSELTTHTDVVVKTVTAATPGSGLIIDNMSFDGKENDDIIIDHSKKYLLRIINSSFNAQLVHCKLTWYEEAFT